MFESFTNFLSSYCPFDIILIGDKMRCLACEKVSSEPFVVRSISFRMFIFVEVSVVCSNVFGSVFQCMYYNIV